ncbi:MAG TPA: hypothetical protein VGL84_02500 [Gaiellaceae bacterium]
MKRLARRRGIPAFALLVLLADMLGRSMTIRVDRALHVAPLAPPGADYYPALLMGVKIVAALGLAALLARAIRVHASAAVGRRLLDRVGHTAPRQTPRLQATVSPSIWLAAFLGSSLAYLIQADADGAAQGPWSVFAPWLHTYALPIFALLSVLVALAWSLAHWLRAVEEFGVNAIAQAHRILRNSLVKRTRYAHPHDDCGPRRRFGLAFESRPPPLAV